MHIIIWHGLSVALGSPGTGLLLSLHSSCACRGVWLVMRHQMTVQVSSPELHFPDLLRAAKE